MDKNRKAFLQGVRDVLGVTALVLMCIIIAIVFSFWIAGY